MTKRGELSEAHARDSALCSDCPKMCRAVCPVGNAECRETTTTWGKMWQGLEHIAGGVG